MKVMMLNFKETDDKKYEEHEKSYDGCMFDDECPQNTCDCDYNCHSDDDCTQDTY